MQEQLQSADGVTGLSQAHILCWRTLAVTLELFPPLYRRHMLQLALIPPGLPITPALLRGLWDIKAGEQPRVIATFEAVSMLVPLPAAAGQRWLVGNMALGYMHYWAQLSGKGVHGSRLQRWLLEHPVRLLHLTTKGYGQKHATVDPWHSHNTHARTPPSLTARARHRYITRCLESSSPGTAHHSRERKERLPQQREKRAAPTAEPPPRDAHGALMKYLLVVGEHILALEGRHFRCESALAGRGAHGALRLLTSARISIAVDAGRSSSTQAAQQPLVCSANLTELRVQGAAARICNPFTDSGHVPLLRPTATTAELSRLPPGASVHSDSTLAAAAAAAAATPPATRDQANIALALAAAAATARLAGPAREALSAGLAWYARAAPPREAAAVDLQGRFSAAAMSQLAGAPGEAADGLDRLLSAIDGAGAAVAPTARAQVRPPLSPLARATRRGTLQRRDLITKHQFALHLIRDSTVIPNSLPQSEHPQETTTSRPGANAAPEAPLSALARATRRGGRHTARSAAAAGGARRTRDSTRSEPPRHALAAALAARGSVRGCQVRRRMCRCSRRVCARRPRRQSRTARSPPRSRWLRTAASTRRTRPSTSRRSSASRRRSWRRARRRRSSKPRSKPPAKPPRRRRRGSGASRCGSSWP